MQRVTQQEYQEWAQLEVTKQFLKSLHNNREELKEGLVTGSFDNPEEIKGRCAAVYAIINATYEDVVGGLYA